MILGQTTQVAPLGNAVATAFSFGGKIFQAQDLTITQIDGAGNLYSFAFQSGAQFYNAALNSTATVSNIDVDTGCLVSFSVAPTSGWTIDIRSNIAETQNTSIKNQGAFFPDLHEEAFDRLTREVQDLRRLCYTYGIHGPDIETLAWPALPGAAGRVGQTLMFGSNGLPALGIPTSQSIGVTQVGFFGVDSGSANAYAITVASPSIAFALTPGVVVSFKVLNTNTGASTLAVNGGPAIAVTYQNLAPLLPGQFTAGRMVQMQYDGTEWQYLGPIFASGSYVGTMTGVLGTITGSIPWTVSGPQLTLNIPNGVFVGTSNSATLTITGMPAGIIPVSTYYSPIIVASDNGAVTYTSFLQIGGGSGTITVWKSAAGPGGWTNSGTKAVGPATVTCSLN